VRVGWQSLVAVLAFAVSSPSSAEATTPAAQSVRRTVGVGVAIGGGASYNVIPSLVPPRNEVGPQASFLNLELRFFFRNQHALHVYSQLGNTIASGIAAAVRTDPTMPGELVFASLGVLYDFNVPLGATPGSERRRWIIAPGLEIAGDIGLGGSFAATRPTKFALRIPVRWGVEWLFGDPAVRLFGVSVFIRAFFEPLGLAQHSSPPVITQGAAALIEAALVWY